MAGADGSAADRYVDDLHARVLKLTRYEAGLQRDIARQLQKLEAEILRQLNGDITSFSSSRLTQLLGSVQATITAYYRVLHRDIQQQLVGLSQSEANWTIKSLEAALSTTALTTAVTAEVLAASATDSLFQGAPLDDWLGRQAAGLQQRFADAVRLGVQLGETPNQIYQRVRGTRAAGYKDGIFDLQRRQAESLTITAVQTITNNARDLTYRENADIIDSLMQISTIDLRTSDICISRDRLRWKLDGTPIGHNKQYRTPPLHFRCRSVMVPVLKDAAEIGGLDLSPSTRASMDGQIPETTSYEQWLKSKPAAIQDAVLGPSKAKLFRAGKITLRDLTNNAGRPLTLEELDA